MTPQVQLVTPEMAKVYLSKNTDNRNKRGWWVSGLASMIKRGEWIPTHQGVAFAESGKLIDGQHRLEAVVEADIPVEMLVVTGVRDDAYKVLDNGIKRTLSDLTGVAPKTAEICRVLSRLIYSGNSNTSAEQCLQVYNTGVGEVSDNLTEYCGKNIKVYSSAMVRTAAVCLILDGYNQQYIKELYANLCNQKFNNLPNIAHAFIRQVSDGRALSNDKPDLLARSLKVFNPEFAEVTRLQISESDGNAANAYCRNVVRNLLTKEKK
jgi:hypothetical protein